MDGGSVSSGDGGTGGLRLPESVIDGLKDRNKQRATVSYIQRAIKEGWIAPWMVEARAYTDLPRVILEALNAAGIAGDLRSVARLASVLKGFGDHNLRMAEVVDKSERLDSGASTENVQQVLKVEFDARG